MGIDMLSRRAGPQQLAIRASRVHRVTGVKVNWPLREQGKHTTTSLRVLCKMHWKEACFSLASLYY
jgi:hypothetical protein